MSKTICIYHSIDLDGWMSGAIVKHWWKSQNKLNGQQVDDQIVIEEGEPDVIVSPFGTLSMLGWNHGDDIPDLSGYDKIIICDITFPTNVMTDIWHNLSQELVWIDHHESSIDNNSALVFEGIQDTKFAACELTWKYFFPNEPMPEIVRLLGRYDCFGHKGTDEETKVIEFQYGARQLISNYSQAFNWLMMELQFNWGTTHKFDKHPITEILEQGKPIYKYLCTEAKYIYRMGKEVELVEPTNEMLDGCSTRRRKFIAINRSRFNPDNFGIDYHADGYDGVLSYCYNKDKFTASLYSDTVDCSVIARTFNGGGHKGAAGFIGDVTLFNNILKW